MSMFTSMLSWRKSAARMGGDRDGVNFGGEVFRRAKARAKMLANSVGGGWKTPPGSRRRWAGGLRSSSPAAKSMAFSYGVRGDDEWGGAKSKAFSYAPRQTCPPARRREGVMGRLVLDGACTGSIASKIVFVMFVYSFGFRGRAGFGGHRVRLQF